MSLENRLRTHRSHDMYTIFGLFLSSVFYLLGSHSIYEVCRRDGVGCEASGAGVGAVPPFFAAVRFWRAV